MSSSSSKSSNSEESSSSSSSSKGKKASSTAAKPRNKHLAIAEQERKERRRTTLPPVNADVLELPSKKEHSVHLNLTTTYQSLFKDLSKKNKHVDKKWAIYVCDKDSLKEIGCMADLDTLTPLETYHQLVDEEVNFQLVLKKQARTSSHSSSSSSSSGEASSESSAPVATKKKAKAENTVIATKAPPPSDTTPTSKQSTEAASSTSQPTSGAPQKGTQLKKIFGAAALVAEERGSKRGSRRSFRAVRVESASEEDTDKKMTYIEKRVYSMPKNFVLRKQHRRFIREGQLDKLNPQGQWQERHFYLFTDLLMWVKPKLFHKNKFVFKGGMALEGAVLIPNSTDDGLPDTAFQLVPSTDVGLSLIAPGGTKEKLYTLSAINEDDKQNWTQRLHAIMHMYVEKHRRREWQKKKIIGKLKEKPQLIQEELDWLDGDHSDWSDYYYDDSEEEELDDEQYAQKQEELRKQQEQLRKQQEERAPPGVITQVAKNKRVGVQKPTAPHSTPEASEVPNSSNGDDDAENENENENKSESESASGGGNEEVEVEKKEKKERKDKKDKKDKSKDKKERSKDKSKDKKEHKKEHKDKEKEKDKDSSHKHAKKSKSSSGGAEKDKSKKERKNSKE